MSIDAEKSFGQNPLSTYDKNSAKWEERNMGTCLNMRAYKANSQLTLFSMNKD